MLARLSHLAPQRPGQRMLISVALATALCGAITSPHAEALPSLQNGQPSALPIQMPFRSGEAWTVGGAGFFYGEGGHQNEDYYSTDWNSAGDEGKPAVAIAAGTVTQVVAPPCPDVSYGCEVRVAHAGGYSTIYGHFSNVAVAVNDTVAAGTVLGYVGNTGNSDGAHLHLSFRYNNGASRYPSPMFTASGLVTLADNTAYTSANGRQYVGELVNNWGGDGRVSEIYIRNTSAAGRPLTISYRNISGGVIKTETIADIPVRGVRRLPVNLESRIPSGSLGWAYIDGAESLAVSVVTRRTAPDRDGALNAVTSAQINNRTNNTGNSYAYIPLGMKYVQSGNTRSSTYIKIANPTSTQATFQVEYRGLGGLCTSTNYTQSNLTVNAFGMYTLPLLNVGGLGTSWCGSVTISTSGSPLSVVYSTTTAPEATGVANMFQTMNAFTSGSPTPNWKISLFAIRLANGFNTPVVAQNISGQEIPTGDLQMNCVRDPGSGVGPAQFTVSNSAAIGNFASYAFNPVTDYSSFPWDGWYGACSLYSASGKNIVGFVQFRHVNAGPTENTAATEATPSNSTDRVVVFPLVAKLLDNKFATAITIQNLSGSTATMNLQYRGNLASPSCIFQGDYAENGVVVQPNASIIRNFRLSPTGPVPEKWCGSLVVTSNQPVGGFAQLTNTASPYPSGDTFMVHSGINVPYLPWP